MTDEVNNILSQAIADTAPDAQEAAAVEADDYAQLNHLSEAIVQRFALLRNAISALGDGRMQQNAQDRLIECENWVGRTLLMRLQEIENAQIVAAALASADAEEDAQQDDEGDEA